ncbi:MAG: hypothetical protein ACK56I_17960, partial [bacterium]
NIFFELISAYSKQERGLTLGGKQEPYQSVELDAPRGGPRRSQRDDRERRDSSPAWLKKMPASGYPS